MGAINSSASTQPEVRGVAELKPSSEFTEDGARLTSTGEVAKLVVRCGGDENRLWNNLLRLTNPELKVRELPYDLLWDKEMMWGSGWR